MTGKIRYNLGVLLVAFMGALVGLLLSRIEGIPPEIGAPVFLAALIAGAVALVRIAADLLRAPQRDSVDR